MRKVLLTAAALGGLLAVTATGASAAPVTGLHMVPAPAMVTKVDYYRHHHHWHHRHWEHNRWRYYD